MVAPVPGHSLQIGLKLSLFAGVSHSADVAVGDEGEEFYFGIGEAF